MSRTSPHRRRARFVLAGLAGAGIGVGARDGLFRPLGTDPVSA
jgi:hypothetical protein